MDDTPAAPGPDPSPVLTVVELSALLEAAFPKAARSAFGAVCHVEPGKVRLELDPTPEMTRPGGIVSGPTLMALADVASYAVVLAHIGDIPMAVTNSLNIAFLRACLVEAVTADAHLLKLGRRLATVDVRLTQRHGSELVAQATVCYALPYKDAR